MNNILITGVNGFIASQLIDGFKDDYNIYGVDITNSKDLSLKKFIQCDITNKSELKEKLTGINFDYVIHCAAIAHNDDNKFNDQDFFNINYRGSKNLIDVIENNQKQLKKFIFFSTVAVYGEYDYKGKITEKSEIKPITAYAKSKYKAEEYLLKSNLSYTILRFAPVYDINFLKDINKRTAYNNKHNFMIIVGKGQNKFSFCHIDNLKNSIRFLIDNTEDTSNEIFNISDNIYYKAKNLLNNLKKFYSYNIRVFKIPKFIFKFLILSIGIFKNDYKYYKSLYWKIAEDNIYSNQKITNLGVNLNNNLYNLLDQK